MGYGSKLYVVQKIDIKEQKINRFINHYEDENVATKYDAGIVGMKNGNYMVAYEREGARETFSVGQPVYDKDKNLMGYLGIGLYAYLDYSTHGQVRIPVEYWMICLPTKYCVEGKKIYTYWQTNQKGE